MSGSGSVAANNARNNKRRALPWLIALSACLMALVIAPASASAFGISGFAVTPSSTQAAGHPTYTVKFNRTGSESEDLRDVVIDLPTGVFANPQSVADGSKCTATQFSNDQCSSASVVGAMSVGVKAAGLLSITAPGTIYVMQPTSTSASTLGLIARPAKICILFIFCAQPQKIFLKNEVILRSIDDAGLRNITSNAARSAVVTIPLIVVSASLKLDITVNSMQLTFNPRSNSSKTGPYFMINTTSCSLATSNAKITSYQNAVATAAHSYTPTGCPSVPWTPTSGLSVANAKASTPTAVTYNLNIPLADATIQQSHLRKAGVVFPAGSGIDLSGLAGVVGCLNEQLVADSCAANTQIGTAVVGAPYLPPNWTGKVYAMEGLGTSVPVGVRLNGPRGQWATFRGTAQVIGEGDAAHVEVNFDLIPQLPYSSMSMTFTKAIYKNPPTCGSKAVNSTLIGFSGKTVVTTNNYTVTDCAVEPNTSITSAVPPVTDNTPTFTFTSTVAGSVFECKVGLTSNIANVPFTACTSPLTTSPLPDGAYTVQVRAINGTVADPSPASQAFTVAAAPPVTLSVTPSTTQAAAHPDITSAVTVSPTGSDLRDITVKLPDGLNGSLAAAPRCSQANATAGTCAIASRVGSIQITGSTTSGTISSTGDVYLTDPPSASNAAGGAAKVVFAGVGTLVAKGAFDLQNNGVNQQLTLVNIPNVVGTTALHITSVSMVLLGNTGGPANPLITNPSNCNPVGGNAFVSTTTLYDGTVYVPPAVPFQATGCASVPFAPVVNQVFTNPVAGAETGVNATVTLGANNSSIKSLRVVEPPVIGVNFPAFGASGDQCAGASSPTATSIFNPAATDSNHPAGCPAQSKVGTMTINTPLLPTPLTGPVHLIYKGSLPWMGVDLQQQGIVIRLTGVTSTPQVDPACNPLDGPCQTQLAAQFNTIPDTPVNSIVFNLSGPSRPGLGGATLSGNMLTVLPAGDPSCTPTVVARSIATPFSGTAAVTANQNISISGC